MSYVLVDVLCNGEEIGPRKETVGNLLETIKITSKESRSDWEEVVKLETSNLGYRDSESYYYLENFSRAIYLDGTSTWSETASRNWELLGIEPSSKLEHVFVMFGIMGKPIQLDIGSPATVSGFQTGVKLKMLFSN